MQRSRARIFLDRLVADGILVIVSRGQIDFSGPFEKTEEARQALREHPDAAREIVELLCPSEKLLHGFFGREDAEDIRREHEERSARLRNAGIPNAEEVSMHTTYIDHLNRLPERLRPIIPRGVEF